MSSKTSILVTGSNGQVGKELRDLAASFPGLEFIFLSREDMPIHHFELVRNFFKTLKPGYCINCAGYTAVDRAEEEKDKAFRVNGEAAGVLAAICKEHDCRLVHISTDYVFDGKATSPYKEEYPPHPINVYGASKWEGEKQAAQLNPDVIIIRTSWVYSSYGKNFVKTMIRLMKSENNIRVVNDQVGSPTYAADLAATIVKIISGAVNSLQQWKPGTYHFSNNGAVSWYEFAMAIRELTHSTCTIEPVATNEYPAAAKRPAYTVLDTSKIIETFGIQLQDWKDSLLTCISKIKS